ncbi:MAG: DNA polymerase, partial [Ectothiorhodospiraceae bacterium]
MTELVLVDGSSYLYRAFHALPPLTNAAGEPTGAVYGVVNMLRKLLDERDPHYIGVVFDAPGRTFRDDLFAEYKANRPPMPEDLQSQTDPVKRIVAAMGLPLVEVPGVEADDAIGTLARQAETDGWDVVVSTGDKDMAQLVSERIRLLNTMSGAWLDPDGVREKFGVPPERIIDYLALVGDTSDNIPGVPKVGPKTAAKWLQQYGDLDSLVQQADSVGGKVGENLRAHLEELPLSRDLATIRCDLKLDQRPKDLQRGEPETPRLRELYRHYDFTGWLEDLGGEGGSGDAGSYRMITTRAELDDWLQQLREAPLFAFDLETDSLDYMVANIVGLSFAVAGDAAVYIPVAHDGPGVADQLDRDTVLGVLQPVLEDPEQPKVGQNLKYDMSVLARHGVALGGVAHDTMLQSYVLDSTATRHDMDSLARKYLGRGTIKYETVAGKGAHQIPFNQVGLDEATEYACEDAVITRQLHDVLWPRLGGDPALRSVYETIEVPLLPVLSRMERHGVLVDRALLQTQSRELAERMGELEAAAHEAAGGPFNLGSPKQIQEILYERQGLPVLQKTPKGQPSTA